MLIPASVYRQFGVREYFCKRDTLRKEQEKRESKEYQKRKRYKNYMIVGDKDAIHPGYLKEKQIEQAAYKFLNKICFVIQERKK
jgi:hypothetical protein